MKREKSKRKKKKFKSIKRMYQSGLNQRNRTSRRYILRNLLQEIGSHNFGFAYTSLKFIGQAVTEDRLGLSGTA